MLRRKNNEFSDLYDYFMVICDSNIGDSYTKRNKKGEGGLKK